MSDNFCKACGAEVGQDKKFCMQCGAPVQGTDTEGAIGPAVYTQTADTSASAVQLKPPPVVEQTYRPQPQTITALPIVEKDAAPSRESKYEPISTLGFIGIWILMAIPLLNLILLIVWATGGCRKINKRNFARSMLIVWAITLVLGVVLTLVFKDALGSFITPMS